MPAWVSSPEHRAVVAALVKMRSDAGLTQRALALKLGLDHSIVARIEIGQRNVSVLDFMAWCRATDVDPGKIVSQLNKFTR